ncbi:MAG TPA: choice-of-anchor D domain-containing protein [Flavobacterium sp.]|jgi:hypothetical protein
MKLRFLLFAVIALFFPCGLQAQIAIADANPVTQNFDALGTSATASLPANWKMSVAGATAPTWAAAGNFTAVNAAADTGLPTAGARYNWGNGTTTTDRAIGFMTSGGYASPNSAMAFYQNTSGSQINDLTISFDYERYRINTAAASITFFTSTDGSTWTAQTSGDSSTFTTGASSYTFTGGTTVSKMVTLTGVNIANGGNIYLRWNFVTVGSNSQGLGLDNVSVTATLATSAITTAQNGNWYTGSTWIGGIVPTNAQNAIINHSVTSGAAITRDAGTTTTINNSGTLTANNSYVSNGATIVNGTFVTATTGGVSIGGSGSFLVSGICRINSGGFFLNAPIYGSLSTLIYSSGSTYGRGFEWTAATGTSGVTPGYPNHVRISTVGTTLDYINGGTPGAKAMAGNLTVDAGTAFYMDYGGLTAGGALTVGGNVAVAGTMSLGFANGDDLKLGGNLGFTGTGSLIGNNRAIFFTKNGTQTITSAAALTIPYIVFQPSSGSTTVQLLSDLAISAPVTGNAVSFSGASDIFDINGRTLTIGTPGVANTVTGSGTFKGSAASSLTLLGTGSVGTLNFTTGSQTLGSLVIDRSAATVAAVLGTPLAVSSVLTLTNGRLNVGNNPLTLASAIAYTGTASNYIIADVANGTSAALRRLVPAAASNVLFPIGDISGDYSPVQATVAGGSYAANAYVSVAVNDIKHPSFDASTEYITRYWEVASSGINVPTTFTADATYVDADINTPALEANYQGNKWSGIAWSNGGAIVNAASNSTNAIPLTAGAINQITAGRRDPDINVKQATTTYLNASTYDFGSVLTGNTNAVTFTIENIGQQPLNLAFATFTGNPNYTYTTAYANGGLNGPSGTRTFTVTFSPTVGGTLTGSISIPSNDPDETPYIINFTGIGVVPAPEINIKGGTTFTQNILSGDVTPTGLDGTQFAATAIGATSIVKTYRIENTGTLALNVSSITFTGGNPGDFNLTASAPYSVPFAGTNYVDFSITFSPTAVGLRTTTVSIAHNDATGAESPYTFVIEGNGTCATATNVVTPTSGPEGTEVTITASANNLNGATVTFNGVAAVVTPVSATQIKVIVPAGATSGALTTTNSQGCSATNTFTIIDNVAAGCQGGNTVGNLFITEVTDATSGGLTYVEIYNGTGASVNLGTYSVRFAFNGLGYSSTVPLSSVTLVNNDTYILAVSSDGLCSVPGGNGSYADQVSAAQGINYDVSDNDHIGLFQGASLIDSFGVFGSDTWADGLGLGDRGATFRRKNNVTVPNAVYNNANWDITDWAGTGATSCATNDYSDIGTFNFIAGNPPVITQQPSFTPSCKATSFTVTASEGFAGGNALAYQWFAVAPGATSWTQLTNVGIYSGVNTATLNISNVSGLQGYQYYVQVRENGATCYSASHAVMVSEGLTVTWTGSAWTPSAPTINNIAVINGNYNTATHGSFEACSVVVNGGSTLTVSASNYVSIQNDLTVNTSGSLQVLDDASVVMIDNAGTVTNNGTTQVYKTTSPYNRYDYTYWSSPVTSTTIGAPFSTWRTDYAFHFNTANYADVVAPFDGFDDNSNAWQNVTTATVMVPAKGYAIMAPSTGTFPATTTVNFSGTLNNGIISIPLSMSGNGASNTDDFNLIGNPYPSSIFANDFINANTNFAGTLYLWTHRTQVSGSNPGPDVSNFITADYAMYNLSGGTSSGTGSPVPTGFVASGQAFFIEAQNATSVVFNNSMRNKGYINNNFYRVNAESKTTPQDRLWLNIENEAGLFSQQLVGYFENATSGFDRGYDGIVNPTSNTVSFYSLIGEDHYRIQGRQPFSTDDLVPLGYSSAIAGSFTVRIDTAEGQFDDDATDVFLQDKVLNIIHDLKQGPYVFTTTAGVFNDRFTLRYTNESLANPDSVLPDNSIVAYGNNGNIVVKSATLNIREVKVYDLSGRLVFSKSGLDSREAVFQDAVPYNQGLIIRILTETGIIVSKKIIN